MFASIMDAVDDLITSTTRSNMKELVVLAINPFQSLLHLLTNNVC